MIHKSSFIDSNAKIGKNVKIGPFCYIGPNVKIDDNVEIISNVHIEGNTKIGKKNKIFPFVSLGTEPQDLKFNGEDNSIEIGEENIMIQIRPTPAILFISIPEHFSGSNKLRQKYYSCMYNFVCLYIIKLVKVQYYDESQY